MSMGNKTHVGTRPAACLNALRIDRRRCIDSHATRRGSRFHFGSAEAI